MKFTYNNLIKIAEKVESGNRLDYEDGLMIDNSADLLSISLAAR